jgi:hypothetical protein
LVHDVVLGQQDPERMSYSEFGIEDPGGFVARLLRA